MRERKGPLILPLLLSLLLHVLLFVGLSLNFLWPKSVSAKKPVPVRIVLIEQPKPKEILPPDPHSRFLADANRKESGVGKPSATPKLKREIEERLPARRGENAPKVASLAPPPAVQVLPPPPRPPVTEEQTPEPTPPASIEEIPPSPKVEEVIPPKPKEEEPLPPEPEVVQKLKPKPVRKKRMAKPVQKKLKPEKRAKRPKKIKPKKQIEVASLPKPKLPADPLAMFRAQPKTRGTPNAPELKLSDEEADRIAKTSLDEKLRQEEEEGEAVSLDTRDFRFISYFAHIKRKIQKAWHWPREARRFEGKLKLRMVLREDGTLSRLELLNTSGYRILDDEAMTAVTKAAPFHPFPPGFKRKLLPIEGTFIYEHSGGFVSR
ncbi:energy transducer TonB [Nitrospinota bacterium]